MPKSEDFMENELLRILFITILSLPHHYVSLHSFRYYPVAAVRDDLAASLAGPLSGSILDFLRATFFLVLISNHEGLYCDVRAACLACLWGSWSHHT